MTGQEKFELVMQEWKSGTLKAGQTSTVVSYPSGKDQALAIAFSEARKVDPNYGNPANVEEIRSIVGHYDSGMTREDIKISSQYGHINHDALDRIIELHLTEEKTPEQIWEIIEVEFYEDDKDISIDDFDFEDKSDEQWANIILSFAEDNYEDMERSFIPENFKEDLIDSQGVDEETAQRSAEIAYQMFLDKNKPESNKWHIIERDGIIWATREDYMSPDDKILEEDIGDGSDHYKKIAQWTERLHEERITKYGKGGNDKKVITDALGFYGEYYDDRDKDYAQHIYDLRNRIKEGDHIAINDKGECVYQEESEERSFLGTPADYMIIASKKKPSGWDAGSIDFDTQDEDVKTYLQDTDLVTANMLGIKDLGDDLPEPLQKKIFILKHDTGFYYIDTQGFDYPRYAVKIDNFKFL